LEFLEKERGTASKFSRRRPVVRWCASHRRADVEVPYLQPVFAVDGGWLVCETCLEKTREEKVAGRIAGENAARPVSPVSGGGEAHDPDPGERVAESRNGMLPVVLPPVAARGIDGNILTPTNQARTVAALGDPRVQLE
jgi:hypothetical protein